METNTGPMASLQSPHISTVCRELSNMKKQLAHGYNWKWMWRKKFKQVLKNKLKPEEQQNNETFTRALCYIKNSQRGRGCNSLQNFWWVCAADYAEPNPVLLVFDLILIAIKIPILSQTWHVKSKLFWEGGGVLILILGYTSLLVKSRVNLSLSLVQDTVWIFPVQAAWDSVGIFGG